MQFSYQFISRGKLWLEKKAQRKHGVLGNKVVETWFMGNGEQDALDQGIDPNKQHSIRSHVLISIESAWDE